jgi:intermembrane space import and assembly protein 40
MADGPCGPQFKEAFSCFIYSEAEPKGIDCVEKFKGMQDCFREHPDIYGEEIADDEDETPLSEDGKIEGKPLPAGHPDQDKVPKAPNAEPPKSSKIPDLTHENQMSKGESNWMILQ